MRREDVNEIGLAVLVIVAVLLAADNVWLHVKCARQAETLAALEARVEAHVNPPPTPSVTDKVKETYQKAKSAAVRQYEAVKGKLGGQ